MRSSSPSRSVRTSSSSASSRIRPSDRNGPRRAARPASASGTDPAPRSDHRPRREAPRPGREPPPTAERPSSDGHLKRHRRATCREPRKASFSARVRSSARSFEGELPSRVGISSHRLLPRAAAWRVASSAASPSLSRRRARASGIGRFMAARMSPARPGQIARLRTAQQLVAGEAHQVRPQAQTRRGQASPQGAPDARRPPAGCRSPGPRPGARRRHGRSPPGLRSPPPPRSRAARSCCGAPSGGGPSRARSPAA